MRFLIPHSETSLIIAAVLSNEGRFSRALRSGTERKLGRGGVTQAGRMRRLGTCLASTVSGGPGYPSGPERGLPLKLAGRGQAAARNRRQATSPEERTRVLRRRGGAPNRRCRVLCFPAIRGPGRGVLHCAFRRSASPLPKGRQTKSSSRAAARERSRVAV